MGVITYYLLYNVYPFLPKKGEIGGMPGLIDAITTKEHKFDPNVKVSETGKDFINLCLKKRINERASSHELLNHSWWANLSKGLKWSDIRSETFKVSLGRISEK